MRRVRGMAPARVAATVGAMLAGLAIAAIPLSAMADLAPGTSDEVQSLAVSPDYRSDRTLFVGGYYSMWKSTDGGAKFAVLSGAPLDIEDIAVSPAFANDKTVFVASKGNRYGAGTGIYRSTDSGGSWQLASGGLPAVRMPYRLRISPGFATDRTVFALLNEDLYKSTDAGGSWKKATPPAGAYPMAVSSFDISPSFVTDGYIVAAQSYNDTIAYSGSGGASWSLSALGVWWGKGFDDACFSSNFSVDRTLWATKAGTIFRSTDGGAHFVAVVENQWGVVPTDLIVSSPRHAAGATLLAGGARASSPGPDPGTLLGRSTDGGLTWAPSERGLAGNWIEDIDFSTNFAEDNTAFAVIGGAYRGGAFVSRDGGANWSSLGGVPATLGTAKLSIARPAKKKTFYVSGTLPFHSFATSVKLQFFRKGAKGYPSSPTVSVTVPIAYGATKYRKAVKLPSTGGWSVRVYHKDADHPASYSGSKSFSVR